MVTNTIVASRVGETASHRLHLQIVDDWVEVRGTLDDAAGISIGVLREFVAVARKVIR